MTEKTSSQWWKNEFTLMERVRSDEKKRVRSDGINSKQLQHISSWLGCKDDQQLKIYQVLILFLINLKISQTCLTFQKVSLFFPRLPLLGQHIVLSSSHPPLNLEWVLWSKGRFIVLALCSPYCEWSAGMHLRLFCNPTNDDGKL